MCFLSYGRMRLIVSLNFFFDLKTTFATLFFSLLAGYFIYIPKGHPGLSGVIVDLQCLLLIFSFYSFTFIFT